MDSVCVDDDSSLWERIGGAEAVGEDGDVAVVVSSNDDVLPRAISADVAVAQPPRRATKEKRSNKTRSPRNEKADSKRRRGKRKKTSRTKSNAADVAHMQEGNSIAVGKGTHGSTYRKVWLHCISSNNECVVLCCA